MNKLKYLLLLVILLFPVFVYAESCDTSNITITSIKKISNTGYTEEIKDPTTDNRSVSTNLKLYDVGDSITYEIKIKNKSNKDYDLNKKLSNSDYISYEIISDNNKVKANEEKTINLKIEYKNKVPDNLYKSNKLIENKQIELIVEDYIINPSTGRNIIMTLLIISFIVLSLFLIKNNNKYKSLLLLLLIPVLVDAACEYKLSINSNIEIRKILPNPCTYEGELTQGAEYTNGQYTYRYMQEWNETNHNLYWENISEDGWGVKLTNPDSTDPVTTSLCSSINDKTIVSMSWMFSDSQATSIDVSSFDTSNVTNMSWMFIETQVPTLDLSSFDTGNVTNMTGMFLNSYVTSLDLTSFDTSNVTDMNGMFAYSRASTLDISSFDTSNVTDMSNMFSGSQAQSLDLSSFDTSMVTNMEWMFYGCQATVLDISSFDTSNVTDMNGMFANSRATILDLSSFNTKKVNNMGAMFYESQATTLDLSSFDTSNVTNTNEMFKNSQATTGYARTQEDADKFNSSSDKPTTLTFVVKNS